MQKGGGGELQINFIYLGNKEIYYIFKPRCIISVVFSTKCLVSHKFILPVQITFFKQYTKLKCQTNSLEVNLHPKTMGILIFIRGL